MRKSLVLGTKTDVQKRRAKELNQPVVDVKVPARRIVTFNHPWVNQ